MTGKDEKPLVSIIIPTYNRAHLIKETLDSVLAQTYKCWEAIIVDDGSTDETSLIINRYG
ncbi:glycosyltransferase family 2 protein [Salegentibacter salegens]|uniref:Glycosyl transferase family 2 n=1 Tax=Salegentibacter salegens TaxID=143223 RepID=A0A1M7NF88_9FLAO|nr:glycosyltransferase [Salegentibacter salegens]PRX41537.1 glycosyl transferase family 2 [Salegentibacter salegens]SHN01909.1 Glycosyl transferase family 2 [Salegentibacter salegens]